MTTVVANSGSANSTPSFGIPSSYTLTGASATGFTLTAAGGATIVVTGTALTYPGAGQLPNGGSITGFAFSNASAVLQQTWSGISGLGGAAFTSFLTAGDMTGLAAVVFPGADTLTGGGQPDTLNGYGGADILRPIPGNAGDIVDGGAGNDTIISIGNNAGDSYNGGADTDTLVIERGTLDVNPWIGMYTSDYRQGTLTSIEAVHFGDPTSSLSTEDAHKVALFRSSQGLSATLAITGMTGRSDIVAIEMNTSTLNISGWTTSNWNAPTNSGALSFGEDIIHITGTAGGDIITGSAYADWMIAGDGNDTLVGGAGNDYLNGAADTDIIAGGLGDDFIIGESGIDTAAYSIASTAASWARNAAGEWVVTSADGVDRVSMTEYLGFNDRLVNLDAARSTFSGDGSSDILFRSSAGTVVSWEVSGATLLNANSLGTASPADWDVLGIGRLSGGDSRADVLWQHSSGLIYAWFMNDGAIDAGVALAGVGPEWSVVGLDDLNGDEIDEIIFRHDSGVVYTWELTPYATIGSAEYVTGVGLDWNVAAIADFDGNGRDDFLWRNDNGQTLIWEMAADGTTIEFSAATSSQVGNDWQIVGTGDFNLDGRDDILWQHSSGTIASWQMDSGTVLGASYYGSVSTADWEIVATGDYNADGRDDILFQNLNDGVVFTWLMGNGVIASAGAIGGAGGSWDIIGD